MDVAEAVIIAHRGEAARFPENTIAALRGAIAGGVRHLEIDVQLSADRIPVLSHDATLVRTAGVDRIVSATVAKDLTQISVGETSRFGKTFSEECLPTLAQSLDALANESGLTFFVEIKRHSLRAFGRRRVLSALLPVLARSRHKIVLISFDHEVLQLARSMSVFPLGWVLSDYSDSVRELALQLAPEYLFCNYTRLPPQGPLWSGGWRWACYDVTDVATAHSLLTRGVNYLEAMAATSLYRDLMSTDCAGPD